MTTYKTEADGRSSRLYLIRSYNHERRNGKTDTGVSSHAPNGRRRGQGEQFPSNRNYETAQPFEIWEVARAATAADLYFEPLEIASQGVKISFRDGGFGRTNNPTREAKREIERLHGESSLGVLVSVGTARQFRDDDKKRPFFSSMFHFGKNLAHMAADPEDVHEDLQDENRDFPYYRLNDPGSLNVELDEWEPKQTVLRKESGSSTIEKIRNAFLAWAIKPDNQEAFRECAAELVDCRRKRMRTSMWDRYARGSAYSCKETNCEREFYKWEEFSTHLEHDHSFKGDDLTNEIERCHKAWRYRPAPLAR